MSEKSFAGADAIHREVCRIEAWGMLNAIHINVMAKALNKNPITLWEQLHGRCRMLSTDLEQVRQYNSEWIERGLMIGRRVELIGRAETSGQCLRCGSDQDTPEWYLCSSCDPGTHLEFLQSQEG